MFLSIHGNCYTQDLDVNGSVVLYNDRFVLNKLLANSIQRELNNVLVAGNKRTIRVPQNSLNFYLLNYTHIPGAIIETVFISNQRERELLSQENFKEEIAKAIADGIEKCFTNENRRVSGDKN